jgi:two-component SAPR family response regulator
MTPPAVADPRSGGGLRLNDRAVLVIEDEYFIADEIRCYLQESGAHVLGPAPDLESARALLANWRVDCAVLDIDLRGETVFPFAHALRLRNVPWVYVTGYRRRSVEEQLSGEAYLEKPINKSALIGALRRLIEPGLPQGGEGR